MSRTQVEGSVRTGCELREEDEGREKRRCEL